MNFKSLKEKCYYFRDLCDHRLMPNSYVLVMVDGRSFSNKIKSKFGKPFDTDFINMMNETARYVCNNIGGVKFAYTQSDEISFVITDFDTPDTDSTFGFRLCKLQSIIASLVTCKFNQLMYMYELGKERDTVFSDDKDIAVFLGELPMYQFDCKCWNVPNENEVYSWFLFRQLDCIRNSKQQASQTYLPHCMLVGKKCDEQIALLKAEKGIDWDNYNDGEKYGRFVAKKLFVAEMTDYKGIPMKVERMKFSVEQGFPIHDEEGKRAVLGMMSLPKPVTADKRQETDENDNKN